MEKVGIKEKKVLLLNMPFTTITYPPIAVSLLKACLEKENLACDTRYFNLDFANMMDTETYESICNEQNGDLFFGERLFASEVYDDHVLCPDNEYIRFLRKRCPSSDFYIENYQLILPKIKDFLDQCMKIINWNDYYLVGFTTMFEQNMSSLALAKRIKLRHPEIKIIFGGANCEGEIGFALHRHFPFVDFVCSGEGDIVLPKIAKSLKEKQKSFTIPGLIHRNKNKSQMIEKESVLNLDDLPYPDYSDYFEQINNLFPEKQVCYEVSMETSRGCWWGERSQCNFCGLNGKMVKFRVKKAERVLDELDYFIEKYIKPHNLQQLSMVDNIIAKNYFADLLPKLSGRMSDTILFWETKSTLNKRQVKALADANVFLIQPGIESLSTSILKLMGKGTTSLHNVQLLKYCKEYGVYPSWNILTGFPGETVSYYKDMMALMSKLTHLQPPDQQGPFMLQRFSPYHADPEKFGLVKTHPVEGYRYIYPFPDKEIDIFAYYYKHDYLDGFKPPKFEMLIYQMIEHWRECHNNGDALYAYEQKDASLLIVDNRTDSCNSEIVLDKVQAAMYCYCESIKTLASINDYMRKKFSDYAIRRRDIFDFLDKMVSLDLMLFEDNKYLGLAILVPDTSC
jgi:ribosomal peptide maturation radical SAM protein 1